MQALQASLGEEYLNWELNEAQLPHEIHQKDPDFRILNADWVPIIENGKVNRLLLCLRDVTKRRQLEGDAEKAMKRNESIQTKMTEILNSDSIQIASVIHDCQTCLEVTVQALAEVEPRKLFLRNIHTLKGASRTLGIKQLSGSLHELESAIQTGQNSSMTKSIEQVEQHLSEYLHLLQKVFGMTPGTIEARFKSLTDAFQNLIPNLKQRARDQMIDFRGFVIQDEVPEWPEGLLKVMADIFLHACNNSLDHGFPWVQFQAQAMRW